MSFEDLDVWKKSARMSADLYREFASLKDYGFKDQITRAGLSIPSNISEGHERASAKENMNFLNYAKGSCGELRTQIYIGMEIGYIAPEKGKLWLKETKSISAMIGGLIRNKKALIENKKKQKESKVN
ncbi:MAG: four helix bundle protein [Deltaproteobacteria bacterium]|nr:four helix bundle protein [Deltaproteobacteria bacterium]